MGGDIAITLGTTFGVVLLIGLYVFLFAVIIVGLISIPFQLIGLYKIAVKGGLKCPWLAFIPYASHYLFGSIAEKFQRADNKPSPKYSKILVILTAVSAGFSLLTIPIEMFSIFVQSAGSSIVENTGFSILVVAVLILSLGVCVAQIVISVMLLVYYFQAFHRICMAYDIDNAKKNFIISICTLGISVPFQLFAMRNKEPVFNPAQRFQTETYLPQDDLNQP